MSRRETAVNVSLGVFLILTFALLCFLALIAILLVVYVSQVAVEHYWPAMVSRRIEFGSLLILASVVSGFRHLRKRLWPNAFLSFAILPAIASMLFTRTPFSLESDAFSAAWPWVLVLLIQNDARLGRYEFALGGFLVGVTIAVNTGLAAGGLSRFLIDSTELAALALLCLQVRQGWNAEASSQALSHTGA